MKSSRGKVVGLVVGIVASVISLIVFVALSGGSPFSQRETAAWTTVLWVLQVGVGFMIGELVAARRAKAEYQPFLKSAIRRTHGLRKGLERSRRNIDDAWDRIETASGPTELKLVLFHEQVIAVQSQLAELIFQAGSSIDDWRDVGVADDEFSRIMKIEEEREQKIDAVRARVQDIRAASADISGGDIDVPADAREEVGSRLESLASDLERQLAALEERPTLNPFPKGSSRNLLSSGYYEDAVKRYTTLIKREPYSYGHYVGRAQAKYKLGDLDAALVDLDSALSLEPDERDRITKIRDDMVTGTWQHSGDYAGRRVYTAKFSQAIGEGNLEEARSELARALEAGLENPAFRCIDETMLETLAGDLEKADQALEQFDRSNIGPYVRVNIAALEQLVSAQRDERVRTSSVSDALTRCPQYRFADSPLVPFEEGLIATHKMNDASKKVFDALKDHVGTRLAERASNGAAPGSSPA